MKWADYYKRYDKWQESTQYSRLASITDFGPEGSPSAEIADCIQYVESRTAASIIRRALAAGTMDTDIQTAANSAATAAAAASAI